MMLQADETDSSSGCYNDLQSQVGGHAKMLKDFKLLLNLQ
jgi:hypothetical protein